MSRSLACLCSILCTAAVTGSAHAGIAQKLDNWYTAADYANATMPGVVEGQAARYLTLGGLSTRSPIMGPLRLVTVQTPKFSAGCGGIDFYAGGL